MYASLVNHLEEGTHYALAFAVLFWFWPKLLLQRLSGDTAERAAANFMRMVLIIIAMGYILVVFQLMEMIAIIAVFVIWSLIRWNRNHSADKRAFQLTTLVATVFDYLEGRKKLFSRLKQSSGDYAKDLKRRLLHRLASPWIVTEWLLLLAVLAGSAYVRFYDAFMNAAPAMSDSYTVLEWMKQIDERKLFETGIYPKGFHIYLDTIFKFAKIDALYINKYSGPLNSILTMLGIYFAVSRFTGKKYAGIVSAVLYGWFGFMIGAGWERQAATNSQEFALVFVLPTLYFFRKYLQTTDKLYFWTAVSGLAVTGLVHQLIYGYLCMGIAFLVAVHWLGGVRKHVKQTVWIVAAGAGSAVISAIPAGIGLAMGKKFQEAAQDFLTSTAANLHTPSLGTMDYAALIALGLLFVGVLIGWKNERLRTAGLFTLLFSGTTFALYYWGGVVTKSVVIAARMVDLWSLAIPMTIGMSWGVVFAGFSKRPALRLAETVIVCALMAGVLYQYPLEPIVPYKMERNDTVEQYLRISERHATKTWMIISQEEGYALVLGSGYHMYVRELLEQYDPAHKYLTMKGKAEPNKNLPTDVYIFEEKSVFRTHFEQLAPIYDRRERESKQLEQWISAYKEANGGIDVFFEDEFLKVYHISRPLE
ncbi:hypothetical protein [Paenibacillus hamazuiensis]|uniref:hypothetical protein n=1 Tax=Paenibacillus hamazuiensis TaxID=2936508 RepID=UPI00200EDBE6|nr:hypothetical protein [Paenibacillus hamazuiensis]